MASMRSVWVKNKATATKVNGGKDPFKEYKIKDQKLGAALDAFEALTAQREAYEDKLDKITPTPAQTGKLQQLKQAHLAAAKSVRQRYNNYEIDIATLVKRDQLKKEVLDAVKNGLVPFYRATRNMTF